MKPSSVLAMLLAFCITPQNASAREPLEPGMITSQVTLANAPAGIRAWRVHYITGGRADTQLQEASAIIMAPEASHTSGPRAVVAWTHGTWGTASKCAPSLSDRFFALTPAVGAVAMGYVVVAPDYPGLGAGSVHPYLVGQPTGQSVIDAVRAARRIPEADAGPRYVVWGESQGGHAALWTAMIAPDARDLELLGVAAGAPPTDLAANFREASDPNARAFLTALAAESWSQYFGVPLELGKRRTPGLVRKLAGQCVSTATTPNLGTIVGMLALRNDLKKDDFTARSPWSRIIAENSISPRLSVPVLLAQTREDPLVSPKVTREFARRACAAGVSVGWIDLPGKDHATTARQSSSATLEWIEQRFAGAPARDDCRTLGSLDQTKEPKR
jgi:acetyl esterase/lipase